MYAKEPPTMIDGARVLKYARQGLPDTPSAACHSDLPPRWPLRRLLYLDVNDESVMDTFHASVSDALAQADYEYEGLNWTDVSDAPA